MTFCNPPKCSEDSEKKITPPGANIIKSLWCTYMLKKQRMKHVSILLVCHHPSGSSVVQSDLKEHNKFLAKIYAVAL